MRKNLALLLLVPSLALSQDFWASWRVQILPECGVSIAKQGRLNLGQELGLSPVKFKPYNTIGNSTITLQSFELINANTPHNSIWLGTSNNIAHSEPIQTWANKPIEIGGDYTPLSIYAWLADSAHINHGTLTLDATWEVSCY
ncbi:exported hypothetical protein [Vibrio coralliirubri]|uniref:hypothetical protein n=1 Tax=Vibrio coralliirubri TaxID=1516159 RepID=UPI00063719AD|nr:hypothetical protein [Vibrio coralliirubri]CDU04675.1 exported hypothetical protein [Vibrio coralliirubri]